MTVLYMIDSHRSEVSVIGPVIGIGNPKPAYSVAQS
jgi:hypothetical protein